MARSTVRVEGLRELGAALGQLPKATARNVLKRVGEAALQQFDIKWRDLAPIEDGNLKTSGGIGTKLTSRQARLHRASSRATGKDFVELFAGPNDPAAVPQEFGTVDQPAQPFMRPAWAQTKDGVLASVADDLGDEIQKAAQRLARRRARRG